MGKFVKARIDRLTSGMIVVVQVGRIFDSPFFLRNRTAARVKLTFADRRVSADIPVRFNEQNGCAVFDRFESRRQTRAAGSDDDDVRLVVPFDFRAAAAAHSEHHSRTHR